MDGDQRRGDMLQGSLTKLSARAAEAHLERAVPPSSNLELHLLDPEGHEIPGALYGKVAETASESGAEFSLRFTSMTPEIRTFLRDHRP